jgi:hypothetical protein
VKAQEWFHANTCPLRQDPYENEGWEKLKPLFGNVEQNMHAYQRTKPPTLTPPPKI